MTAPSAVGIATRSPVPLGVLLLTGGGVESIVHAGSRRVLQQRNPSTLAHSCRAVS